MALNAYGHLSWTVGNSDWTACFDAIREDNMIRYHVVVNCESGGFVDTIEYGACAIDKAVAHLKGLPDYWVSICYEHYQGEDTTNPDSDYYISTDDTLCCTESWVRHLERLTHKDYTDEDEYEEEPFDPIRNGWVGKDGRP